MRVASAAGLQDIGHDWLCPHTAPCRRYGCQLWLQAHLAGSPVYALACPVAGRQRQGLLCCRGRAGTLVCFRGSGPRARLVPSLIDFGLLQPPVVRCGVPHALLRGRGRHIAVRLCMRVATQRGSRCQGPPTLKTARAGQYGYLSEGRGARMGLRQRRTDGQAQQGCQQQPPDTLPGACSHISHSQVNSLFAPAGGEEADPSFPRSLSALQHSTSGARFGSATTATAS